MKLKWMSVVSVLLLAALVGCSGLIDGIVSGGDDDKSSETVGLNITVENLPSDYNARIESAQNRTILPDPYNIGTTGLTWKLSGTASSGLQYPETAITIAAKEGDTTKTTGTATLSSLGPYIWELTLTAYKTIDSSSLPVLVGRSTVDLRNGGASITFKMGTDGLETRGTVKITGSFVDGTSKQSGSNYTYNTNTAIVKKYTVGLYNVITNEAVTYSGSSVEKTYTPDTNTGANASGGLFEFTYDETAVKVAPGTYRYAMTFYNDATTLDETTKIGYYSDLIVVDPGNDLEKDIGIVDVIGKAPAAPSNFTATLINNTEDDNDFYQVKLDWQDNSNNETNFKLEVLKYKADKVAGTTTIAAGSDATVGTNGDTVTWYGLSATDSASTDFYGNAIRAAGTLLAGSTTATIKLELGYVYELRLAARNKYGQSAYVERTAPTVSDTTTYTAFAAPDGDTKHINRMRVRYNLNGGQLVTATETIKQMYYTTYEYYSGVANENKLMAVYKKDDTNKPWLYSVSAGAFKYWVPEDAADDTETNKTEVYAFKKISGTDTFIGNTSVKAVYANTSDVTTYTYTDMEISEIALTALDSASATSGTAVAISTVENTDGNDTYKATFYTLKKSGTSNVAQYLKVALTNADITLKAAEGSTPAVTAKKYSKMRILWDGNLVYEGALAGDGSFVLPQWVLGEAKTYALQVLAYESAEVAAKLNNLTGGQWYSKTIQVTLDNTVQAAASGD